jgi:hypothetical protein
LRELVKQLKEGTTANFVMVRDLIADSQMAPKVLNETFLPKRCTKEEIAQHKAKLAAANQVVDEIRRFRQTLEDLDILVNALNNMRALQKRLEVELSSDAEIPRQPQSKEAPCSGGGDEENDALLEEDRREVASFVTLCENFCKAHFPLVNGVLSAAVLGTLVCPDLFIGRLLLLKGGRSTGEWRRAFLHAWRKDQLLRVRMRRATYRVMGRLGIPVPCWRVINKLAFDSSRSKAFDIQNGVFSDLLSEFFVSSLHIDVMQAKKNRTVIDAMLKMAQCPDRKVTCFILLPPLRENYN